MTEYRFRLQKGPGKRKLVCPECGKRGKLTKYIDTGGRISFPDYVGRCDREDHCRYNYTPSHYFAHHPQSRPKDFMPVTPRPMPKPVEPSFISRAIMERTLAAYERNPFALWLATVVGQDDALRLLHKYNVGTAAKWGGATVFWQVDRHGRVRTGKVMGYDPDTGKRIKEPTVRFSWAHHELNLAAYYLRQCFFGEHLLADNPSTPVAIVESEKTAIIASHFMPQMVWLASGGKHGCLNAEACKALAGRDVMLVPDLGAMDEWKAKLPTLQAVCRRAWIYEELERQANDEQRAAGLDIADFLLMEPTDEMVLANMIRRHPYLQPFIDALGLTLVKE